MNYLAHLFLSDNTANSIMGNFLGDFVKGNPHGRFPAEIAEGIITHRKIDLFTDSHPVVSSSKKLISLPRRRFAGIIIDIIYDHFLSRNWDRYSRSDLNGFVERMYRSLENHEVNIPQKAEMVIEKMIKEDWLRSYGTLEGIDTAFKRISRRLKKESMLSAAVEELENHYQVLNDHFLRFFPHLMNHTGRRRT